MYPTREHAIPQAIVDCLAEIDEVLEAEDQRPEFCAFCHH
jgi:hypothetical protein